jgi:hypothetical protein
MDRPVKSTSRGTTFLDLLLVFAIDKLGINKRVQPRELIVTCWDERGLTLLLLPFPFLAASKPNAASADVPECPTERELHHGPIRALVGLMALVGGFMMTCGGRRVVGIL